MALTQVPASMQESNAQYTGFKNRIINGAMMVDQRKNGSSVAATSAVEYTLDRWAVSSTSGFGGQLTAQRSTIAPSGFANSLSLTVTTADSSIGASEYYSVLQRIEGYSVADLGWGAAGASTVTLSFWVRASIAGTYSGSLRNNESTRSYIFEYSISSANTWEQKTVTIVGETSGTWLKGNGLGIDLWFSVGTGSTYRTATVGSWQAGTYLASSSQTQLIGTLNATFYITGVQLEKGSTATSFDYRPYGTELALCQRYCQVAAIQVLSTSVQVQPWYYKVSMRATPTITGGASGFTVYSASNEVGYPGQTTGAQQTLTASAEL